MSTTPYPLGQTVRMPVAIRDADGQPADPIALELTIWLPDGTTVAVPIAALSRASVGAWYYDYLPSSDGQFGYRFVSIGPNVALDGQFTVSASPMFVEDVIPGWAGAYLTVPEFLASPAGTAVNTMDLIPGGSTAQQRAELANVLLRASQLADSICLIPLGAHEVVEHQEVYVRAAGTVQYAPRQVSGSIPLIAISSFAYGAGPGSLTSIVPQQRWVQDGTAIIPLGGAGFAWSGALQFGAPGAGSRVLAEVTYTAGFPCTTFSAPAAVAVTALEVTDATGIMPGERLRVHDPGREEQVMVAAGWTPATGPAVVPLAGATAHAHRAGTGVADMPMDIKTAVGQIAASLIRRPTDTSGQKTPAVDTQAAADSAKTMAAAVAALERYRREGAD